MLGCLFDRRHIGIGQAEMMADLMHQHMFDDGAKGFVVLGPIVENRTPIKPDHVGHLHGGAFRTKRQADAMKQAEQVELGFGAELVEHLVSGKVVDANDDICREIPKPLRQARKYLARQHLELGQRRRLGRPQGERIGGKIGHIFSVT